MLPTNTPSTLPLFLSSLLFTVSASYIGTPVGLGSSLAPLHDSSWVSDNHVFALGFVDEGSQNYSLSIYYFQLPHKTVVWTANWGRPVSSNAVLELQIDGDLVLSDGGVQVWRTNTGGEDVINATVSNTGTLLLNNDSQHVWQSSNSLTDTLLPGQTMFAPSLLVAAKGRYVLSMQTDGNLVLYFLGSLGGGADGATIGLRYWASHTYNPNISTKAVFDDSGNFKMVDSLGTVVKSFYEMDIANTRPMRLQLTESGLLILFVLSDDSKSWTALARFPSNQCAVAGICGQYEICNLHPDQTHYSCQCPPGFQFISNRSMDSGCVPNIPFDCNSGTKLVRVQGLEYGKLGRTNYYSKVPVTEQGCIDTCRKTCYCMAAQFSNNSGCFLKTLGQMHTGNMLRPGTVTYLKVSMFESSNSNDSLLQQFNSQQSSAKRPNKAHLSTAIIVGVTSAFAFCAAFSVGILACCYVRRKRGRYEDIRAEDSEGIDRTYTLGGAPVKFSFRELQAATNRFRKKLGDGGFGSVYKGILAGGTPVAVKRLESLNQGGKQFQAEVATIGAIHHKNLVRLRGYCAEGSQKLLVYEFMEKGSLDRYLFRELGIWGEHGNAETRYELGELDWEARVDVALGTAKAICYLHEECKPSIIHCDIKPENILLDDDFSPKVSDFGLAKLLAGDRLGSITSIRGTTGYMAPEWMTSTHITAKVDVFSYGMVLLEIITGRRRVDLEHGPATRTFPARSFGLLNIGGLMLVLDPRLIGKSNMAQLERVAKIAFWCILKDPHSRPPMNRVVQMLDGTIAIDDPPLLHASGGYPMELLQGAFWVSPLPSPLPEPSSYDH